MNLLRRPLRPQLRPFLLSDVTPDGRSEQLSPLSSISSSTSDSPPSSRPSTATRAPRYLPPLGEENEQSCHVSLVTPFQSEQLTTVDRLTGARNDQLIIKRELNEREKLHQEHLNHQKLPKKHLKPLKTREYSQFSALPEPRPRIKPKTLNKTPKFKGPPGLPVRRTRSFCDPKSRYIQVTDDEAYAIVNEFTFNDFILHSAQTDFHRYEETSLERAILSRYTYKQICEMIAERVWAERGESGKIHVQTLVPNIEPFQHRVPMHQIVTEMALLLRRHMSQILGSHLKMNIRALPSWRQKEGAHTEILLYENPSQADEQNETKSESKDSHQSANAQRDTAAEIAVLDSLLRNGTHLDLRAFTLERLPDISLMYSTLVAVDLSYNCLTSVPKELFNCTKLEHLYLRHNPVSLISTEMSQMKSLVFLDLSFCQLQETLPHSLFNLTNLRHLDVSYNRLITISRDIFKLKNLRQFVCDGNEITYLPASILSMENLKLITVKNTWLIPQFSRDESSTKPPKLLELLTVRLSKFHWKRLMHKIPESSKTLLFGAHPCDSCSGLRVGNGFRSIINFENVFGIKLLPILFVSCTPECLYQRLIKDSGITYVPSNDSYLITDQFLSKLKMRYL